MRITLEKVVDDIKNYVSDNKILNTTFTNDITDDDKDDIIYPLVFIRYGNVTTSRGNVEIDLSVLFTDLLNDDKSNYVKVMSDMLLQATDFKTNFRDGDDNVCNGWHIDESSSLSPFRLNLLADMTAGYELNATVIIGDDSDRDNLAL